MVRAGALPNSRMSKAMSGLSRFSLATTYEASGCSEVDLVSLTPLLPFPISPCARAGGMA